MNQLNTKRKSILITGGAGFIGSYLAEHFISFGHKVHIIDNLSTGSIKNLDSLIQNPYFSYTIADMRNESLLAELVDRSDEIYHLAAAVGVRLVVESPIKTIEINIGCTESLLRLANKKNKKVIMASTSEVYGKNDSVPFKEDDDLVMGPTNKPRWAYACSKAIDEFLTLAYGQTRSLPVLVLRFFNTVGPRQTGRYGMVLPNFVKQALMGQPITVYGDGSQSRCFSYVDEVVQATAALAACPNALGQVINVGSDQEISIGELAKLVKRKTDSDSKIIYIPYDKAYKKGFEDMPRRVPDISQLKSLIGIAPSMGIDEIVEQVIHYFKVR